MNRMKKAFCITIAFFMIFTILDTAAFAMVYKPIQQRIAYQSAAFKKTFVKIDGNQRLIDAYAIGDTDYVNFRAAARYIAGTSKEFELEWDAVGNTIRLYTAKDYTVIGNEISLDGSNTKKAVRSSAKVYKDGKEVKLTIYLINGKIFVKLAEITQLFNIQLVWDIKNKQNIIDTSRPFNANLTVADIKKQTAADRAKLDQKARDIISKVITPGMSELQKEVAIHNYFLENTVYDSKNYIRKTIPYYDYTAYGVLINGTGVCEGFSEATKLLLNKVGIECLIVVGISNGEGHGGNIVKIDGVYYHLDVTWDTRNITGERNSSDYGSFNLTDLERSFAFSWEGQMYPKCTTKFEFADILKARGIVNGQSVALSTFVQVDGKYIYFEDTNDDPMHHIIYKIKLEKNAKKEMITEFYGINSTICKEGDWLYYYCFDTVTSMSVLKKIKADGSGSVVVDQWTTDYPGDFFMDGGNIYLASSEHVIKRIPETGAFLEIFTAQAGESIQVKRIEGDWIYYSSCFFTTNSSGVSSGIAEYYKVKINGTGKTKL